MIKGGTWSLSDISGSHAFIMITYNNLGHNAQDQEVQSIGKEMMRLMHMLQSEQTKWAFLISGCVSLGGGRIC